MVIPGRAEGAQRRHPPSVSRQASVGYALSALTHGAESPCAAQLVVGNLYNYDYNYCASELGCEPSVTNQIEKNMIREDHPVWTVYDKLRTARLNVKYYSRRLQATERLNFGIDFVLLATAPSSAIAGLWFWNTEYGRLVWQWLGAVAALAAISKPLLSLTKRIKDYEGILSGYRTLEYDLMEIKSLVEQKKKYDQPLQAELKKAIHREKTLIAKNPETRESARVKRACENEVRQELPHESFFIPKEE